MTDDIIAVLRLLPEADLKEIDAFIINIFRKFEAPELGELSSPAIEKQRPIPVENMRKEDMTVLHMRLHSRGRKSESSALTDSKRQFRIKSFIYEAIKSGWDYFTETAERFSPFFHDPSGLSTPRWPWRHIRRFNQQGPATTGSERHQIITASYPGEAGVMNSRPTRSKHPGIFRWRTNHHRRSLKRLHQIRIPAKAQPK
jgi:hypothetical protein